MAAYDPKLTEGANAAIAQAPAPGIERGTLVYTMNGPVPVEALNPGDRIVTRSGAMALRMLDCVAQNTYRMVFDAPEIVYLDCGQVDGQTGIAYLH